jgi:hypothetical protein
MSDESEETKKTGDPKETPQEVTPLLNDHPSENSADTQKSIVKQIIKTVWTHEPWLFFKVIVKSNEEMGEYIALHGLVPQNELPIHLRNKIPENEIWMRENVYADIQRRRSILAHEYAELDLMVSQGMGYKEAHQHAEFIEHLYYHD